VDAGPVHPGDNPSRHSTIMMKIKLNQEIMHKDQQSDVPKVRKPAWYKATQEDKNNYTELLDMQLREIFIPDSLSCTEVTCQCSVHSHNRDSHVIDTLCTLV
jgi:hypothetical protein